MVVEVVEEEVGVVGALEVLPAIKEIYKGDIKAFEVMPGTAARVLSVGVAQDGRPDEGVGPHVVHAQVLHHPDGLPVQRGLPLPPPLLPESRRDPPCNQGDI